MNQNGNHTSGEGSVANTRISNPYQDTSIGERIAARRKMLHMSQAELGQALGVSRTTVSEYETGKHAVSTKDIQIILRRLSAPIEYFTGKVSLVEVARMDAEDLMYAEPNKPLTDEDKELLREFWLVPYERRRFAIRAVSALQDPVDDDESATRLLASLTEARNVADTKRDEELM